MIVCFGRVGVDSMGFVRHSRLRVRSMLCLLSTWIVGRDSGMGLFLRATLWWTIFVVLTVDGLVGFTDVDGVVSVGTLGTGCTSSATCEKILESVLNASMCL